MPYVINLDDEGPIVSVELDFDWKTFELELASLKDKSHLDDTDLTVFSYALKLINSGAGKETQGNYHLVNLFKLLSLVGTQSQTTKKPMSRASMYNRVKKYKELVLIKLIDPVDRPLHLCGEKLNKRREVVALNQVVSALIDSKEPDLFPEELLEASKQREKDLAIDSNIIDTPLDKLKSQPLLGNFIARILPNSHTNAPKTTEIKLPIGSYNISISASCLAHTNMMDKDDLVVAEIVYSKVREYVINNRDILKLSWPVKKTWQIRVNDVAAVLKSKTTSPSGKEKINCYKRIERISSTEFVVDISSLPKDNVLRQYFTNDENQNVDRQRLRLFSIENEIDSAQMAFIDTKASAVPSTISITLPASVQTQIEHFVMNDAIEEANFLSSYSRDKLLIKQKTPGYMWSLNSYLLSMLNKVGRSHGPMQLDVFLKNYKPPEALNSGIDKNIKDNKRYLFHNLLNSDNQICSIGAIESIRNARADIVVSIYDKLLYVIWTNEPTYAAKNVRKHSHWELFILHIDKATENELRGLAPLSSPEKVVTKLSDLGIVPVSFIKVFNDIYK